MKCGMKVGALSVIVLACAPVITSATVIFNDDFDAGTSGTRYDQFNQDNDTAADPPFDTSANFNFNYGAFTYWHIAADESTQNASSLIPSAPRSTGGSTIGLRLDANSASPTGTAIINLYPKLAEYVGGVLPSGDVKLTFDVWMNYNGRFEGGVGSTEFFTAGIQQQGGGIGAAIPAGDPNLAGLGMAVSGDRGNTIDYRYYQRNTRQGSLDQETGYVPQDEGPGLPGPADGRNTFTTTLLPFLNPNDANDQWYETPGAVGKHWNTVEIKNEDGIVYYYLTPAGGTKTLIAARTDESVSSGHLMVGYSDLTSSGVAALENGDGSLGTGGFGDHSFGIFDNITLETTTQTRPKWNVNASGNWSDPGNWLNGVPNGIEKTADFTDGISGSGKTITVDADHTIRAMIIDNAQPYTFAAGGGKIVFDSLTTGIFGTIKVKNGSHTINAPIDTNRILWTDIAGTNTLTINGTITGTSPTRYLKKTGAGTLILGSNANAWTGDTRVEGGTLRLAANNAIPNNAFTTSVNAGATLDTNGFNFSTGTVSMNGGSIIGSGTITAESHLRSTGGGTLAANLNIVPTVGFTGHRELITDSSTLTVSGNISGAPKFHQYSTGTGAIVLSGTSTYTGATAIRGGTMIVGSNAPSGAPGALGNSTTPVEVGDSTVIPLASVRAATTAAISTTNVAINTGTGQYSGVGLPTAIDGVNLVAGDRILIKNGTTFNGVYVVTTLTDTVNSIPGVWDRATDNDESSELQYGTEVTITAGTTNINRKYYLFEGNQINTSTLTWGQELANSALLTRGAVTIGRNVNVLATGNTGTATIGGSSANPSTFSGAVTLSRNTTLTAASGGTVVFSGALNASGVNLTKTGAGTVAAQNYRANAVTISAGILQVLANGGAGGTSVISTLSITPGAGFDLKDNDLVVNNGSFTTIKAAVLAGFGGSTDIHSSTSDGSQILALFDNAIIGATDWNGLPIGANAVVGKYTYFGDVNFDGQVTGDDYTIIDSNLNTTPPVGLEWLSGDANLDGIVTGDDYTTIDSNLGLGTGNPLTPNSLGSLAAVPEPGSVGAALVISAGVLTARRRGRGQRSSM